MNYSLHWQLSFSRVESDQQKKNLYKEWAIKDWLWFKKTGMINKDDLFNDGLTEQCKNNGGITWWSL